MNLNVDDDCDAIAVAFVHVLVQFGMGWAVMLNQLIVILALNVVMMVVLVALVIQADDNSMKNSNYMNLLLFVVKIVEEICRMVIQGAE